MLGFNALGLTPLGIDRGITTTPVSTSISSTAAISLQRSPAKRLAIAVAAAAILFRRSPSKALAIVVASATARMVLVSRSDSISVGLAITLRRIAGKIASLVTGSVTTSFKAIGKALSVAAGVLTTASVNNAFIRIFSTSLATTTTARRSAATHFGILVTSITGTARAAALHLGVLVSSSIARAVAVASGIQIAVASASAALYRRALLRTVNISALTAAAVSRGVAPVYRAAVSTSTDMMRGIGKRQAINPVLTVAVSRFGSLTFNVLGTSAVTATKRLARRIDFAIASATGAAKSTGKIVLAFLGSGVTHGPRSLTRALSTTVNSTVSLAKAIRATLFATQTLISVSSTRLISKLLLSAGYTTVSLRRSIMTQLAINVISGVAIFTGKIIPQIVAISVAAGLAAGKFVRKTLRVTATGTIIVEWVSRLARFARRLIGQETELDVIGRSIAPTIIIGVPFVANIIGSFEMTVHDPIDFVCGDSWDLTGPLNDAAGLPMPMVGASVLWILERPDGTNVLTCSLTAGISILNVALATILIRVTPQQSAIIPPGNYRDWLRITLADGRVFTEWTGTIRAAPNPAL